MRVLSLNVVYADIPDVGGSVGITAIDKRPITGRRTVTPAGIEGDHRCDTKHHGQTDHAVYVYAREDLDWWQTQLGVELANGCFGENLTTSGVDWNAIDVGTTLRVGTAVLQVSAPRIPCSTFSRWLGQEQWVRRFNDAGRHSTYLRVLQPGDVGAGDDIEVVHRPGHGCQVVDVAWVFTGDRDPARLARVADCDDVDAATREKALAAQAAT